MDVINFKKIFAIVVILFSILLFGFYAFKLDKSYPLPKLSVSKEQSAVNLKSDYVNLLSFGHSRLLSSILWITTLIEVDLEHYQGSGNSWMYHRFLTISKLEPMFYHNYLFGGQYLSIVKDDIYGADTIYSIGTKFFPDDFKLNYNAGFNAAFEIGDTSLALKYYDRIYDNSVTQQKYPSLLSVINKLRLANGDIKLEQIYELYLITWEEAKDEDVKNLLAGYLYDIKAEMDLNCLASNPDNSKCATTDFFGDKYFIDQNNKWKAVREWKPYRLNKKSPSN